MTTGNGSSRTVMFVYGNGRGDYLPLNQEPTLGQRKWGRYTNRHDVTGSAFGSFEGHAPSHRSSVNFRFRAGYRWELVDAGIWLRAGSPDLTAATQELLLAHITGMTVAIDPTETDGGRQKVEKTLAGRLELSGHGAYASLTSFTLWPDIPEDPTARSATFGQVTCRLPAADGVLLTVALGLSWQVEDRVRWYLDQVNEPGKLCEEILVREVGGVIAAFEYDRVAEAQVAVLSRLADKPIDPGHGLVVSLKSVRVEFGGPRQPVDTSTRTEPFVTKLSTSDSSILVDAEIDISWRIRDPALWMRNPIDDPSGWCQREVAQWLREITRSYSWNNLRAAEQAIDERICRRTFAVGECIELTVAGVQLRPPSELEQPAKRIVTEGIENDITKARTVASLARAQLIREALDKGLDPDVLRVEFDPAGPAVPLSNLSARRHADDQRKFELLVIAAEKGWLEHDLAQRIFAAAGVLLGTGDDAEQRPRLGYRGGGLRRDETRSIDSPSKGSSSDEPDEPR
ncbi:hypothetical protein [Frankia sp. CiP1_Cm_nod2]|uniref:hypothetical protein n=1 Tax=Frankia sp. CiP1_Cm_nod2 TaxID=2897161 RepID=UPI0020249D30